MLRKMILALLMVALIVVAILVAGKMTEVESQSLTFVIIPAEEAVLSREQFAPMTEYLARMLGQEVELLLVSDYTAVVEAMKRGDADIARFGPFNYVLAVQESDVEAIAAGIKKSSGAPDYRALIVARGDRSIDSLTDRTLAYVDVGSASGHLFPSTYIKDAGIELGEVMFAGTHGAVIQAVKNGTVDAGAIADNRYRVAIEEGIIGPDEFVILWESEPIPNSPVAVQKSMDPALKRQLLGVLLEMPQEIVESTQIGEIGFAPMSDSDYDPVRAVQAATQ